MNASEAYKLTTEGWSEKDYDIEIQEIILGWEDKVKEAAAKGEIFCSVGIFKKELIHAACDFFAIQGYLNMPQPVNENEASLTISWANTPYNSRGYLETLKNPYGV